MIDVSLKVSSIKIDVSPPDEPRFWQAMALEEAKEIRKRTETDKVDVDGRSFKPYTTAYKKHRAKKGRGTTPNLSFTGKMLGALGQRIRPRKDGVKIQLSGNEGFKAWATEKHGREWFDISDKRMKAIAGKVARWIKKHRGLKR